jgi:hypothetical protein
MTPEEKSAQNRLALRNFGFLVIFIIIIWSIGSWLTRDIHLSDPTPAERAESWRQQKQERAREKNYIENIKPYVPR